MNIDELTRLVRTRRSIRSFKPDPIPDEYVDKILEVARWAMSGANGQPWEFIVVREMEKRRQVMEIFVKQARMLEENSLNFPKSTKDYLKNVSTFIIVCADSRFKAAYPQSETSEQMAAMYRENSERIHIQSISAAICNMLLATCSLGLGTVWYTGVSEDITEQQLRDILKIPDKLQIICCLPLGYPKSEQPTTRCPRPVESMVHFNEFDTYKWRSDQESCYRFWRVQGSDCAVCIRVCPYSHPATPLHDLVRRAVRRNAWARRIALWADDLLYGRQPKACGALPDWHARQ